MRHGWCAKVNKHVSEGLRADQEAGVEAVTEVWQDEREPSRRVRSLGKETMARKQERCGPFPSDRPLNATRQAPLRS
jgi:hypothetical protein